MSYSGFKPVKQEVNGTVILLPLVFPVPTFRTFEGWVPLLLKIDRYFLIVQNVNNSAKMFDNTGHRSNADAETGKKLLTVPSHAGPVRAVAWIGLDDDFGTFASASHDQAGVCFRVQRSLAPQNSA